MKLFYPTVDDGMDVVFMIKTKLGIEALFDAHVVVKVAVAEVAENTRRNPGEGRR